MRVLFLSNYYPPHFNGGYEQQCQEVAGELVRRGHRVGVLTAHGADGSGSSLHSGVQVRRVLHLEVEGGLRHTAVRLLRDRNRLEEENLNQLRSAVGDLCPDAVAVWGMWNVPRSVPAMVEHMMAERTIYYLCDYWPSLPSAYLQQWQAPSARLLTRWPKRAVGNVVADRLARDPLAPLKLERPICVSRAVRSLLVTAGIPVGHAQVIHLGIEPSRFSRGNGRRDQTGRELKLLYAGRLAPEKGVHTAIRALANLDNSSHHRVTLDIVGGGETRYVSELKELVGTYHLGDRVAFRGNVDRSEMPAVFNEHDALLFPSEWEEPFARTVLEAMAAGLVVIGTITGGTGEVLAEGETGLTFHPGDSTQLATQIQRLLADPTLRRRLATTARWRVEEEFTLEHMVDKLETVLGDL